MGTTKSRHRPQALTQPQPASHDQPATLPTPPLLAAHTDFAPPSPNPVAGTQLRATGPGCVYVALFDYAGQEGDLSFRKDDEFEVVAAPEADWWLARSLRTGQQGYVPSNFLVPHTAFSTEPWFHGELGRAECERLLLRFNKIGAYLVRQSSSQHPYTLSVRDQYDAVKHYAVRTGPEGDWFLSPTRRFKGLAQLVAFYSQCPEGLCTRLTVPCPKAAPYLTDVSHATRDNYEIPRSAIRLGAKLGEGNFGAVYRGTFNGVTEVAVKELKPGTMGQAEFLREAQLMKRLQHRHLVRLYAICTAQEPMYIVLEYMARGSLLGLLRAQGQDFNWRQRADMCAQVAAGMAYMEGQQVLHRDLAARNVLVSEQWLCKVADFGLARCLADLDGGEEVYAAREGTQVAVKWTAPEALFFNKFSTKSDVWSFGILMWEMATHGATPYAGLRNKETMDELRKGYRLPRPDGCPQDYWLLAAGCWAEAPDQRPAFGSLQGQLEALFDAPRAA